MIELSRSVEIASPPAEVWAVLSDFGAISQWAANVDHSWLMSEQTEGPGAVRRIQTGRNTIIETVEEWEPGSTLSYCIEGLPPVVKSVVNTWTITPTPTGSTVTLTSRVDAGPRPPQKLIARAIGHKLAEASEQMLTGLQEALA